MTTSTILSDNGATSGSAGLKTTGGNDGTLVIQTTTAGGTATTAMTLGTDQSVTFAQAANLPNTFGFKNRIINGAMMIDQRNAGASVTPTDGQYTLDRWVAYQAVASKYSVQQNAGAVTLPAGFINYLGVTSLSAYTVGAGEYFGLQQRIEGLNIADLAWGTASAATVTLSFWVRSSLTGTFGGSLKNSANTRSYPFTYTISSANTWEQKSITIPGETSGTWLTTSGVGIQVVIGLGIGSTFSGTAGAWASANYWSATGATSVVGTNGATFYITGVQLEKGSTATSFDYRPYGTELQLCQRYYEKTMPMGTVPTGASAVGCITYWAYATTELNGSLFKVTKRSTPTVTMYNTSGTSGQINGNTNTATAGYIGDSGFGYIGRSGNTANSSYYGHWTAESEL